MQPQHLTFDVIEYSVFGFMLGISALIGIYFGFIKGGQDTVSEYLLGGKQMGLFPISMSLTSSFISGILILGYPTEIYLYGTQFMVSVFSLFAVHFVCAHVFIPVFYKLQLISIYEYLELRFDIRVRKMVSLVYALTLFIYIPLVIYGPAIALNQVSGFNIYQTSAVVCAVCIFYTTVGGLKAVVWTDTLQTVIMILSCIFVAIIGTIRVGGLSAIWQAAEEGDRLEFFNFDPSPFSRSTFWTAFIGMSFNWNAVASISPSAVQRFISLNTMEKAQWSVVLFNLFYGVFMLLSCFMGLVMYAAYKSCDPASTGMIQTADQILPYFILDKIGDFRGISGLFLAGVVSAALSTMSTGLNTVSGTIYEDFLEPVLGKTTERRASNIMKVLSAVFGIICVLLVVVVDKLGKNLVELANAFLGLTNGANLGMFLLGVAFPQATGLGAIVGGLSGIAAMTWVMVGSRSALATGALAYQVKPMSVEDCPYNITGIDLNLPEPGRSDGVFLLYQLSVFYYVLLGSTTTIVVGLIVSYLTGANKAENVERKLLSPVIYRFLPVYKPVPVKEPVELDQVKS